MKKDRSEIRSKNYNVPMTKEECEKVTTEAQKRGVSKSSFCRNIVLAWLENPFEIHTIKIKKLSREEARENVCSAMLKPKEKESVERFSQKLNISITDLGRRIILSYIEGKKEMM